MSKIIFEGTDENRYNSFFFKDKDEDSQKLLHKFVRFIVTLGLKILRLLRLKLLFEANIIKR